MNTKVIGVKGEELAKQFLLKLKYKIVEQNYTNKLGEIDIIARDGDITVFVEVKRRSSTRYGLPREAITPHKQHKIRIVATLYLQKNKLLNSKVRFDCIEILGNELVHIKNAF